MNRWLPALALALVPIASASERLGDSPHGRDDACAACHGVAPDGSRGGARPSVETCRGCHPDADMHPVGVVPRDVAVPAAFPLEGGAVTCATCHAEPACDDARSDERPWLRGGTPDRKADFCFRCHESDALRRASPHPQAGAPGPAPTSCPACHVRRPVDGAAVEASALRLTPQDACATCHPGPVHAGTEAHLGHHQPVPPSPALPLAADGAVGCWSCHDVHAAPSAAPARSPLAAALSGLPREADGAEALLALPATDGSLCRACHGTGP